MPADVTSFVTAVAQVRAPLVRAKKPPIERFMRFVLVGEGDECDLWTGTPDKTGYGQFNSGTRAIGAHRWILSYALGRDLAPKENANHTCDTPLCVKLSHLYLGTQKQNVQDMWERGRARTWAVMNAERTHCKRGHEFTTENTRLTRNGTSRSCRACQHLYYVERKAGLRG
jgi:hypothetical protein